MNSRNDDIILQSQQDDLTTDDNAADPVMQEEGEDPAAELGIPSEELKRELDKEETDDGTNIDDADDDSDIHDDQREYVTDLDDNDRDQPFALFRFYNCGITATVSA